MRFCEEVNADYRHIQVRLGICKEASVFEHVLDFLIDAVEGGTQRVRNGGGVFGFQGGKARA
jgi:hypothetical protein